MDQQRIKIFINRNSITAFRRMKRLLYGIFLISIMSTAVLFGQSDLFSYGNNRPVADAGLDIKTQSKGSIFLDASRSFISNGSKLKYQWIFAPGLALNSENNFSSEGPKNKNLIERNNLMMPNLKTQNLIEKNRTKNLKKV